LSRWRKPNIKEQRGEKQTLKLSYYHHHYVCQDKYIYEMIRELHKALKITIVLVPARQAKNRMTVVITL
jgi:hypothetical protein